MLRWHESDTAGGPLTADVSIPADSCAGAQKKEILIAPVGGD